MAASQAPTHEGQPVTIRDTESHYDKVMLYVTYEDGPNAGASRWVFGTDVEGME